MNEGLFWLYHLDSNRAFLGLPSPITGLSILAPAIQKTEIECKNILIRKLKWRSEFVNKIIISTDIESVNNHILGYRLK